MIPDWREHYLELEQALLLAHTQNDIDALIDLYTQAADAAELHRDFQAARFYLTQAHVFALHAGSTEHATLQQRLDVYHE